MRITDLRTTLILAAPLLVLCPVSSRADEQPAAELSVGDAVILGVVEGITEFLPISSTGHLIIANRFLGLEGDTPLRDAKGGPLWYKHPKDGRPGKPMTITVAANAYAVIIQVGAILAVAVIYWQQLLAILLGLVGRNSAGVRLLRNILAAFVPTATFGFLAHEWIDEYLFSVPAVIAALVGGALLMFWAERWRKANTSRGFSRIEPSSLSLRDSAGIGLVQCVALWPGTSRSMMVIVGGYLAGLSPAKAAEFSFLVGLPTLAGAAAYKAWHAGPEMIQVFGFSHVALGGVVAAISAALAVKFLVNFLTRHGLSVFAWYRLGLAVFLGLVYWL